MPTSPIKFHVITHNNVDKEPELLRVTHIPYEMIQKYFSRYYRQLKPHEDEDDVFHLCVYNHLELDEELLDEADEQDYIIFYFRIDELDGTTVYHVIMFEDGSEIDTQIESCFVSDSESDSETD